MNKMKVMVMAVLVLVLGAFSLYAEEVNESKLTNLSYVKKTYKTKYKYVREDGFYYYSSDGKAAFFKFKTPEPTLGSVVAKIGIVNVDDEVYGRMVIHSPKLTFAFNLHGTEYSFKGKLAEYFSEEDVEDIVKEFKDLAIEIATDLKKKN